MSARVVVEVSWGFAKLKRLKVAFQLEVAGHVTVTAGATVKCEIVISKFRMGAIWGFVPEVEPRLRVELAGGITETAEVKGYIDIGAEYRDGDGIHWIHKGGVDGEFTEPNESVSGKLKVAFGPKMALKFTGIVGPALYGALFLETTLTPLASPWWRTDAGVSVEGTFDVDLWFTQVSYTLAAFDVLRFALSHADGGWPGPTLTGGNLPAGVVGTPYSAKITVTGGTAPYTLKIVGGSLPAGLALNGGTGAITGIPTSAGGSTVTIEAKDANGRSTWAPYHVLVTTGNQGGGKNVLVVGTFQDSVDWLAQLLTQAGYQVTVANDDALPADLSPYGQIWDVSIIPLSATDRDRLVQFAKAGGGVYLTGERPCCEDMNAATADVIDKLVVTVGGVQVGGLDDPYYATGPLPMNPAAVGSITQRPFQLTTFQPSAPGGMANIAGANVLSTATPGDAYDPSGVAVAAAWDRDEVVGGGRLVVFMDVNWLEPGYRDDATAAALTQNLALYLSGLATPPAPVVPPAAVLHSSGSSGRTTTQGALTATGVA